jgi:hypothetical protein
MSVRISKKRDYRPHAEALHGARVLLNMSANQPKGCYYLWMGSLLLSAFAFEGYLNFLGRVLFPSWESFERTLSWQGKVNLLGDRVGFVADEGCESFQTVKLLFKFRDRMARPKPQELTEEYVKSPENLTTPLEMYEHIKSDEEKFCSEANAKLCSERVYDMMESLYKHAREKFEAENPHHKDSFILYSPWLPSGQSGSYSMG